MVVKGTRKLLPYLQKPLSNIRFIFLQLNCVIQNSLINHSVDKAELQFTQTSSTSYYILHRLSLIHLRIIKD